MVIGVVSFLIAGFGACYLFGFVLGGGGVGIWWGMASGLLLAAILMAWRMQKVLGRLRAGP